MSREGPAFSNGTEWEMWAADWCYRPCLVDAPYQNDLSMTGCPLIVQAMCGEIPDEWIEQPSDHYPSDAYHCINFKPPGWRDPEPRPKPEPPQDGLFERPKRGTRILLPLIDNTPAPLVGASSGFPNQEGRE